ncbi:protocadherin Fat 4 [Aplysia californica]|uniref:Protocadherin Fat 4 n=1 Tax=Aplysia californica TaxID=6500 RepID=A0ABM1VUR9_APLCA|nr:protocadherin Fat 4 [Aplysia californica]
MMPLNVSKCFFNSTSPTFPPGSLIVTASATDADSGTDGEIVFSLLDPDVPFVLEPDSGQLLVGVGLDAETQSSYELVLLATDKSTTVPRSASVTFTVSVADENDNSPSCDVVGEIVVTPDTNIGTILGQLNCIDPDPGAPTPRFTKVSGDPNNFFLIDAGTGEIRLATRPDEGIYKIQVDVEDGGADPLLTIRMPFQVKVETDLHIDTLPLTLPVAEDTGWGDTILTLTAAGGYGPVTFSIMSGNGDGVFHIDKMSGAIKLLKTLDKEGTDSYALVIKAVSVNGYSAESNLDVIVTDANDNSPKYSNSYDSVKVSEGVSTPTFLRQITATDADTGANAVISYSILSGNDEMKFSYDSTGNLQVVATLDYDLTQTYILVLQATDNGSPALTGTTSVFVEVEGVDEHVPVIVKTSSGQIFKSIAEDAAVGGALFQISAADADFGSEISFSFTGGNSDGHFTIDQNSGVVYLVLPLDRQNIPSYSLDILVSNELGQTDSATVEITVTDANDNDPVFDRGNYVFEVPHGTAAGDVIGTLAVSDRDEGVNGRSTLSITSGDPGSVFTVNGFSIQAAAVLDANVEDLYSLVVSSIVYYYF